MAQAGVVYVAVAAAAVSAGALGFSVIWSYEPPEALPPGVVSPLQPPVVVAPAEPGRGFRLVAAPAPAAPDTRQEAALPGAAAKRAAPPIMTATAMPGTDARRSDAASSREREKSGDVSAPKSAATAPARTGVLEPMPARTPSIDARASTSPEPPREPSREPPKSSAPLAAPATPKPAEPVRETALAPADPVKPVVGPPVQSRHANVASPKIDAVVADVPQVIRMPPAATPLAPSRSRAP